MNAEQGEGSETLAMGIKTPVSPHEREITELITSLKTLTVRDGRVSIDPSEVLLQPGYLEDRKRAAQLVKKTHPISI